MAEDRKTPDEWLKTPAYQGLIILDPDGWDRSNFAASWAEPLTQEQFQARVYESTCMFPKGIRREWGNHS